MSLVEESKGTAPQIPDGVYTFQITDVIDGIRQSDTFGKAGEPTVTLRCLIMGILNEEGEDVYLDPLLARKFSRGGKYQPSNLYLFAKGAGVVPPEGYPFDTDLLNGRVLMGKIETEVGKWPKVVPEALMPVKAVKGQPVPLGQKAQEAPSEGADAPPWAEGDALAEAEALAQWFASLISLNLKRDDIVDAALDVFGKPPKNLTAAEREQLGKSLRV